jgi:hypothetical protein
LEGRVNTYAVLVVVPRIRGNVDMLAVLGAGDHGQPSGHGAALGGVVGEGVAQLGILVTGEQEGAVGPAALPGPGVGVQGAADEQAAGVMASMRSRSPLARIRPSSPALTAWSFAVQMIRSPQLAWAPPPMVTAGPGVTMPRVMRLIRAGLCGEAIRLGRLLAGLMPDEPGMAACSR